MSLSEKFASIMAKPGQDPVSKDDVPWWMKYAGRCVGTVGSFIAIFFGVWNVVSVIWGNFYCFLGGMWQMLAGFIVITIEAPCCCLFIDFVQSLSDWVDKKPYWQRAAAYCGLALPPVLLCFGPGSLFGSGLIFATGMIYGMMSVGKKASREEMRAAVESSSQVPVNTNTKSSLVEFAQPIGVSDRPGSNV